VRQEFTNTLESKTDEIFDLLKSGDQKGLEQLFTIYFARLNDFARNVVKDEFISQEIVLDVFFKVWEKRLVIERINIEAYLFRLVRNRCIDHIKHLKVVNNRMLKIELATKLEELYRIDFIGNEPYILIQEELKAQIEKTINRLPERCREVFILSRMNGLKNKEVAEKLNISIKNVERHLNRAMKSFRESFSGEIPIALIILVLKNLGF